MLRADVRACPCVHTCVRACVLVCVLTPRLSDPAVVDQVPHQRLRAALGRCDTKAGSHKTFSIIQSPLSRALLDNVTFRTTRACRARK